MSKDTSSENDKATAHAARIAKVRKELRLDKKAPSEWSYTERTTYNKALGAIIVADAHAGGPGAPAPAEVAKAERALKADFQPLETYGPISALSDFSGELVNQAEEVGSSVASVGEGVKNLLGSFSWLVPVAGLIAVVILLKNLSDNTRLPTAAR